MSRLDLFVLRHGHRLVIWAFAIAAAAMIGVLLWLAGSTVVRPVQAEQSQIESWLVLVVDISGSITGQEYEIERAGYVAVLLDPMIASALDRTAVTIVEFDSVASVVVRWGDVRDAGAAYRVHQRPSNGMTCVACALEVAIDLLRGKRGRRVIDISGDGRENVRSPADVMRLRDHATALGIRINSLAILVDERGKCTKECLADWYAELASGFSMSIVTLDDFRRALYRKLFAEVAGR